MTNSGQDFSFPKREKLTGKKQIEELFQNGSSFYLAPLMIRYLPQSEESFHRVLCTVSKRKFKKAVDRNLIKRRLKEAYRLNKQLINPTLLGQSYHIAILFTGKTIVPYNTIEHKLKDLLLRLQNQS